MRYDPYEEAEYYAELHGTDVEDELAVELGESDFCPGCGACIGDGEECECCP